MGSDGRRRAPPPPPDPRGYEYVNSYLEELHRWLAEHARITFGADFVTQPGPSRHVKLAGRRRVDFEVWQTAADEVTVAGGYAVSKLAHDLYSEKVIGGISADTDIWARYSQDTGAWDLVSSHPVQTGTITPEDGKVTVRIATVTWSTTAGSIDRVTQHHIGSLVQPEISPVPENGCMLWLDDVASIPDGFEEATELRGVYVVGLDSGDPDYDEVGAGANTNGWTGYKLHGVSGNNHAPHWHTGTIGGTINVTTANISYIHSVGGGASSATVVTAVDPAGLTFAPTECPTGGMNWCDAEADTDNRPPSYVAVWIRRAFA